MRTMIPILLALTMVALPVAADEPATTTTYEGKLLLGTPVVSVVCDEGSECIGSQLGYDGSNAVRHHLDLQENLFYEAKLTATSADGLPADVYMAFYDANGNQVADDRGVPAGDKYAEVPPDATSVVVSAFAGVDVSYTLQLEGWAY